MTRRKVRRVLVHNPHTAISFFHLPWAWEEFGIPKPEGGMVALVDGAMMTMTPNIPQYDFYTGGTATADPPLFKIPTQTLDEHLDLLELLKEVIAEDIRIVGGHTYLHSNDGIWVDLNDFDGSFGARRTILILYAMKRAGKALIVHDVEAGLPLRTVLKLLEIMEEYSEANNKSMYIETRNFLLLHKMADNEMWELYMYDPEKDKVIKVDRKKLAKLPF